MSRRSNKNSLNRERGVISGTRAKARFSSSYRHGLPSLSARRLETARRNFIDDRFYRPSMVVRFHPARTIHGHDAKTRDRWMPGLNVRREFIQPDLTAVCHRRKQRRQVIFASGKSGGRHRRPKRNRFSTISCKG